MTRNSKLAALLVPAIAAVGCSLITDFDTAAGKFSLDANLDDTVTVTLSSAGTGTIALVMLDEELPDADDATLLALIDEDMITLSVANDDTGTSVNLTDGARVEGTPTGAGEYALALSEDRMTLTITFYNDIAGSSLVPGGAYTAAIQVLDNDHFNTENLTRTVTVTNG
jgi:hypothetical protein